MIFGIILSIVIIGIIVLFIIIKIRKTKYKNFIIKNSVSIDKLLEINNKYDFEIINDGYYEYKYDNDISFNNVSCSDYLIYQLQYDKKVIEEEIKKETINRNRIKKYLEEVDEINAFGTFNESIDKLNIKYLKKLEVEMFNESILSPKKEYKVFIRLIHTDINGKYLGRKEELFYSNTINSLIKRLNNRTGYFYNDKEIWNALCRVERGKVSNKMRFSIYDRDGYRCRYCGRSGKFYDLEIDHIKPISKGGKSTYDNLQTLCKRCNKEKGNKY